MPEQEPAEPVQVPGVQKGLPVLAAVEERLVNANSPQDVILWTQVRGEILRQDNILKDQEHRRRLERIQVQFKMGLSIATVLAGAGLVVGGFQGAGLFVLGAGLYGLAPDYVKGFFRRREESEND